jgi:hypothetical protein
MPQWGIFLPSRLVFPAVAGSWPANAARTRRGDARQIDSAKADD